MVPVWKDRASLGIVDLSSKAGRARRSTLSGAQDDARYFQISEVLADGHQETNPKERKFEDVVKSAEQAAVLVLVYGGGFLNHGFHC